MFAFIGNTVQGGWNAVTNVIGAVGSGAGGLVSSFFPAKQSTQVQHVNIKPMESSGETFRSTSADASSLMETAYMRAIEWRDTPYEEQFGVGGKTGMDSLVATTQKSQPWFSTVADLFDSAKVSAEGVLTYGKEVRTVVDTFMETLGFRPRETVDTTPNVGAPEGQRETHLNPPVTGGPELWGAMEAWGKQFIEQAKGLFSVGYTSKAPAAITAKAAGVAVIAVIILWLVLGRKK